eukprot:scaffold16860_cov63-Phaeocystis_antarctica.AAC.2
MHALHPCVRGSSRYHVPRSQKRQLRSSHEQYLAPKRETQRARLRPLWHLSRVAGALIEHRCTEHE